MPTLCKAVARIDAMVSRFTSGRRLGGFLQSRVFLAALAAAALLLAPARATAQQNLFVSVQGKWDGNTNSGTGLGGNSVVEYAGGTESGTVFATVPSPIGLGFDSLGDLFVGDNNTPSAVSSGASLWEVPAGGTAVAVSADLQHYSFGLTVDHNDNVYIVTQGGPVQKIVSPYTSSSNYSTFIPAGSTLPSPSGLATDPSGNIWVSNATGSSTTGNVQEYSSAGTPINTTVGSGTLSYPVGMGFDTAGNLYVADIGNITSGTGVVYKYTESSGYTSGSVLISSTALGGAPPDGIAVDAEGDVYVSLYCASYPISASSPPSGSILEFSPSGTLMQTLSSGLLAFPTYMTFSGPTTAAGIEWSGATSGDWSDGTNWTLGTPPGIAGATNATAISTDTALFDLALTSNTTVTVDANRNVMNITFDTANVSSMTLTGGPLLLTSGGVIQITAPVVNPQIINAPLVLEGNYTFTSGATLSTATLSFGGGITSGAVSGTTTLTLNGSNSGPNTISGVLSDNGSAQLAVAVSGTGVWVLNGATSTYTGGTTIASGATLELAGSVSALSQTMNVVNSGSLLVTGGNQTVGKLTGTGSVSVTSGSLTAYQIVQNSLTIGAGATVTLVPSGSGSTTNPTGPNNINFSSTLTSLSIAGSTGAWTGTLDIGNNGLVIEYGKAANDPYATIDNMIETGFDSAHWDGMGITSSLGRAAAESHTPLNIGLLDFTPGTGIYSQTTFIVFAGQTVTTNAILIRLTYMDDINMYGDMSAQHAASDALTFAANYGSGTTWSVGDLTHQGLVGSAAALLFASNYATGLASLDGTTGGDVALGSGVAAVPEPANVVLAALGALGLSLFVRRQGR